MGRLTLSTVGIKSPLDVDESIPADAAGDAKVKRAAPRPRPPRSRPARPARSREQPSGEEARFYGTGSRVQTSMALDPGHAQLLEELARAAHVTVNALAVAALQAGLPAHNAAARAAIVEERVRRVGVPARVERNLRLPLQLRARVDELVAAARESMPRVNRADLVNAALGSGLPADAQRAAELVEDYARRLERAAAA